MKINAEKIIRPNLIIFIKSLDKIHLAFLILKRQNLIKGRVKTIL